MNELEITINEEEPEEREEENVLSDEEIAVLMLGIYIYDYI